MPRLLDHYRTTVVPLLQKELGVPNVLACPRVEKVVLNVGFGSNFKDATHRDAALHTLARISGQKPVPTAARKSISNFKIRKGNIIGARVTLRGARMYEFLDKLISIALPRVRDFRGLSPKGFDGHGNYAIGFNEHVVFPEISPDEVERIHGLEVVIVTTAKDNRSAEVLLRALGLPLTK